MNRKPLLLVTSMLLIAAFILSATVLYPALSASQGKGTKKQVPSRGSIKSSITLGVYSDQACTIRISSIDWGILEPGSTTNKAVYIRNQGTTPSNISMTVTNWNPSTASNYITLNWNYAGQTLAVNEAIQITFTLTILATIQGQGITTFSFDTTIATV